jgi:ABC-type glycerol-3-phosphate transport system permease component
VSRVLTFDYLGALAVSLVFPLVLAPRLGLSRTGFLFGMLNVAVALFTLRIFRDELPHDVAHAARGHGAGGADGRLCRFELADALGGTRPVRRRDHP